jgi:hypothetical protein
MACTFCCTASPPSGKLLLLSLSLVSIRFQLILSLVGHHPDVGTDIEN